MNSRFNLASLGQILGGVTGLAGSPDVLEASKQTHMGKEEACRGLTDDGTKCKYAGNTFAFHSGDGSMDCDSYCSTTPGLTKQLSKLVDEITKCAQAVRAIHVSVPFVRRRSGEREVVGSMVFNRIDGWEFNSSTEQPGREQFVAKVRKQGLKSGQEDKQDRKRFVANVRKQGLTAIEIIMTVPQHDCHVDAFLRGVYIWEMGNDTRITLKCTKPGPGIPSRNHEKIVKRYGVAQEEAYYKMVAIVDVNQARLTSKATWATPEEFNNMTRRVSHSA